MSDETTGEAAGAPDADDADDAERRAWRLIERHGYAAAALAVLPVPYSETLGVTAIHVGMVVGVARVYGVELGHDSAARLVGRLGATVGLSYLGTRLAIGTAKLILPVLPGLLGAPLVFASTLGLGAVARAHLASPERELTDDEVRALYRGAREKARGSFDPARVRSAEARADASAEPAAVPTAATARARERLERLRHLRDQGFLAADEFEAARRKLDHEGT
ncbi:MAG: DUF697 domain-containing protein [Planctomycetes bacterium]|nr:DUF697 domain-containing protein [Planctomycetota bacterium]